MISSTRSDPITKRLTDKNGAPFAQAAIKRILNRRCHEDWDFALGIMPAVFATDDVAEARKAFVEKRKPRFTGK